MNAEDTPPPGLGFETVIGAFAAVAKLAVGMTAVICVVDWKVVFSGDPLKFTTDDVIRPVPLTVIVKSEEPTGTDGGETVDKLGVGFVDGEGGGEAEPFPPHEADKDTRTKRKNTTCRWVAISTLH